MKIFDYWDDILAGVLLIGCIILVSLGHDGDIKAMLGATAAYILRGSVPNLRSIITSIKSGGKTNGTS